MIFHYIPYHNHIPYIIVVSHDYPMTMPAHLDIMAPISGHVFAHRHLWSRTLLESTTLKAFDVLSISALCAMEIAACCFHSPPDYLLRTVLAQLRGQPGDVFCAVGWLVPFLGILLREIHTLKMIVSMCEVSGCSFFA